MVQNTESLIQGLKCDICRREDNIAGVASSPFGPISFCYCIPCLQMGAQPEFILEYLYSDVGTEGEGLHDAVKEVFTFKDDKYWTWTDWVAWRKLNPPPEAGEA